MAEKETDHAQEDLTGSLDPSASSNGQEVNGLHSEINSTKKAEPSDNIEDKTQREIIALQRSQIKAAHTANIIAIVSASINVFMIIATYLLFRVATVQTKYAADAARAASDAVAQSILSNNISKKQYDLAMKVYETNNESGSKAFQLSQKSLDAQIAALKENQKEYTQQNEPNLQLENFQLLKFDQDQMKLAFVALSPNRQITTISSWHYGIVGTREQALKFMRKPFSADDPEPPAGYINADPYPIMLGLEIGKYKVKPDANTFYFYGAIKYYISAIREKKMVYRFVIELFPKQRNSYKDVWQENVPFTSQRQSKN